MPGAWLWPVPGHGWVSMGLPMVAPPQAPAHRPPLLTIPHYPSELLRTICAILRKKKKKKKK